MQRAQGAPLCAAPASTLGWLPYHGCASAGIRTSILISRCRLPSGSKTCIRRVPASAAQMLPFPSLARLRRGGNRHIDLDLTLQVAVRIEDLYPPVAAIGHVDVAFRVVGDAVRRVELTWSGSTLAP